MGLRILDDVSEGRACLYCSTSEVAFGPLFDDTEHAISFLNFIGDENPRRMGLARLAEWHSDWLAVVVPCKFCLLPTTADSKCCDETCEQLLAERTQDAC